MEIAFAINAHAVAQNVINWLALGSLYALLGIGIAAVFAVVGLINFAHGEVLTISAVAMLLLSLVGVPWEAIVPLAILVAIAASVLMERLAFRPVRNAPAITLLLTSLGLSLIIQNAIQIWRGPRSEPILFPDLSSAQFRIGGLRVQWIDVAVIVTTLAAVVLLNLFLRRSVIGLAMRASSEDFVMTRLMGVPANTVIMAAFAISGLLAGLAAFFYFGAIVGQIQYNFGFPLLLKGFIAAVIGGLGSVSGAILGGFLLAALETIFTIPGFILSAQQTAYTSAIVFSIVILVLLVRPQGILGGGAVERV